MFVALVGLSIDLFGFVAFEETFHRCIVIAITFSAHALQAVASEKSIAILEAGELRATILSGTLSLVSGCCENRVLMHNG